MKTVIIGWVIASSLFIGLLNVKNINRLIKEVQTAYTANLFTEAESKLTLLDSLMQDGIEKNIVQLNLAHTKYFNTNLGDLTSLDPDSASLPLPDSLHEQRITETIEAYRTIAENPDPALRSIAYNQIGVIAFRKGTIENETSILEAIEEFKQALLEDENNAVARYNYELLQSYTEYPKRIKAKAQQLVREKRYEEAYDLMTIQGEKDARIAKEKEFTQRIKSIIDIQSKQ